MLAEMCQSILSYQWRYVHTWMLSRSNQSDHKQLCLCARGEWLVQRLSWEWLCPTKPLSSIAGLPKQTVRFALATCPWHRLYVLTQVRLLYWQSSGLPSHVFVSICVCSTYDNGVAAAIALATKDLLTWQKPENNWKQVQHVFPKSHISPRSMVGSSKMCEWTCRLQGRGADCWRSLKGLSWAQSPGSPFSHCRNWEGLTVHTGSVATKVHTVYFVSALFESAAVCSPNTRGSFARCAAIFTQCLLLYVDVIAQSNRYAATRFLSICMTSGHHDEVL